MNRAYTASFAANGLVMTAAHPTATTEAHPDAASAIHSGAARVVAWMLHEGRANTHMRQFGDDMCRRVVEAGIPLWRAFCAIRTLHPQIAASAYVWRRGETGATRRTAEHGIEKTPAFAQSPLTEVSRTGRPFAGVWPIPKSSWTTRF